MTNAGWYPDPAGTPNTYRYWDGQSWSQMTTSNPPGGAAGGAGGVPAHQDPQQGQPPQGQPPQGQAGPASYGAVPPTQFPPSAQGPQGPQGGPGGFGGVPAGGYGGPGGPGGFGGAPGGYGQQPWSPAPKRGGSGKVIGLAIAGVLVVVLLGVGAFFGIRAVTDDDDKKTGPEVTDTNGGSPGPSSTITPTGIQCTGGDPAPDTPPPAGAKTVSGGGLTIGVLNGYTVDLSYSEPFSFANDVLVQYAYASKNWVSEYIVGGLPKDNGFESPAQAAEIVMQCLTRNERVYKGFDSRTDLKNEEIEVDGKPAHLITSEIRVDDPTVTIEGDVTSVVIVDTGDEETYGLYIGVVPIGDTALIQKQETVIQGIQVG